MIFDLHCAFNNKNLKYRKKLSNLSGHCEILSYYTILKLQKNMKYFVQECVAYFVTPFRKKI